jgi:hypothetical protein
MEPFSGSSPCIKCGTSGPYSEYVPETTTNFDVGEQTVFHECLKRTCRYCKYAWNEQTKDSK